MGVTSATVKFYIISRCFEEVDMWSEKERRACEGKGSEERRGKGRGRRERGWGWGRGRGSEGGDVTTHHDPVDGRRDGHSLGSHIQREHFRRNDPSQRSPSDRKPSDIPINHKHRAVTRLLVLESRSVDGDNGGDGSVRDGHVGFSQCQHGFSTEIVDEKDGGDGHNKVDDTDDTSREERDGSALETDLSENSRSIVDDGYSSTPNKNLIGDGMNVPLIPVHCCNPWAAAPSMSRCKRGLVVKSRLYSKRETLKVTSSMPYRSFAASRSTSRSACKARNSYWTSGWEASFDRRLARVTSASSSRPDHQQSSSNRDQPTHP